VGFFIFDVTMCNRGLSITLCAPWIKEREVFNVLDWKSCVVHGKWGVECSGGHVVWALGGMDHGPRTCLCNRVL